MKESLLFVKNFGVAQVVYAQLNQSIKDTRGNLKMCPLYACSKYMHCSLMAKMRLPFIGSDLLIEVPYRAGLPVFKIFLCSCKQYLKWIVIFLVRCVSLTGEASLSQQIWFILFPLFICQYKARHQREEAVMLVDEIGNC